MNKVIKWIKSLFRKEKIKLGDWIIISKDQNLEIKSGDNYIKFIDGVWEFSGNVVATNFYVKG